MKKKYIISLTMLLYFCALGISIAQNPVQNIDYEDRVIMKGFIDSLLLHHHIDSIAAKKVYDVMNNRLTEGYYDKYADNAINYVLQLNNDIQLLLNDDYFECYYASPSELSQKDIDQQDIIIGHWSDKDDRNLNIDSLKKIGRVSKIPLRVFTRGWQGKGWFGGVRKYIDKTDVIKYKVGYNAFGVPQLQILEGNMGYIKIKHWIDTKAMNMPIWTLAAHYLYNTSAIVIDLRDSGEGDIAAMFEFLRYFLPASTTPLGSIYYRQSAKEEFFFNTLTNQVQPYKVKKRDKRNFENYMNQPLLAFSQLKGKNVKLLQQPIYILTDNQTVSISEYFTYLLRRHRRAVLVGAKTAGYTYITHDYTLWAGSFRVRIPDTKIVGIDSLHHKGLTVDITSETPLEASWLHYLQTFTDSTDFSYTQSYLDGFIAYQKAKKNPIKVADDFLQSIVGNYALEKKIVIENNELYFEDFGKKKKMIAVGDNLFLLTDFYEKTHHLNYQAANGHYAGTKIAPLYLRFDKNDLGKPALFIIYFGGSIAEFEKL